MMNDLIKTGKKFYKEFKKKWILSSISGITWKAVRFRLTMPKVSFYLCNRRLTSGRRGRIYRSSGRKIGRNGKGRKVLAIGEIGLDYHWMTKRKELQQEIFRRQLALAERVGKPVVIHTREAMEDTVRILQEFPKVKGILHCYPGSVETAKRMTDRFYLGIGGVLTFKNAKKLVDVVREISLEHLVLETDCPYMAPTPYRGQRNEPIYTKEVAMKIAEIKGISYEEVVEVTNKNTRKAYGML